MHDVEVIQDNYYEDLPYSVSISHEYSNTNKWLKESFVVLFYISGRWPPTTKKYAQNEKLTESCDSVFTDWTWSILD